MRSLRVASLCAFALVAAARPARAELIIPPGQDEIVAQMLGRDAALPSGCVWAGASVAESKVTTTYKCASETHVFELRRPEEGPEGAPRTAKFAVVPVERSAPPELLDAIVARVRAGEGAFRWAEAERKRPGLSTAPTSKRRAVWLGALLAALAVVLLVVWRSRRKRDASVEPIRRRPPVPMTYAVAATIALPWLLMAALRQVAEAAAAAHLDRGLKAIAEPFVRFLLLALVATLPASIVARAPSRRRLWPVFGVALVTTLGIRIALEPKPTPGFEGLFTQPPNARWETRLGDPPVTARTETNDLGFRGLSFQRARTPDVPRVVLIGDSFVFGIGVELDDTLGVQLERALAKRWPGRRFDVINLGIPGNNIASHVDVYETAVRSLAPDAAVMGVHLPNDRSRWDFQVAQREAEQLGMYSLALATLGSAGSVLYDLMFLESETTAAGLMHLQQQSDRLSALRQGEGVPLLVVFAYHHVNEELTSTLGQSPHTAVIGSGDPVAGESIPGDGHPTGAGNRRYADLIAEALAGDPAFAALAR